MVVHVDELLSVRRRYRGVKETHELRGSFLAKYLSQGFYLGLGKIDGTCFSYATIYALKLQKLSLLQNAGPDLGLVRPQANVIPRGAPTAPYPNYINNFIKILSNAFRVIVILQPFIFFL